jgi:hypothetical protein
MASIQRYRLQRSSTGGPVALPTRQLLLLVYKLGLGLLVLQPNLYSSAHAM